MTAHLLLLPLTSTERKWSPLKLHEDLATTLPVEPGDVVNLYFLDGIICAFHFPEEVS